ncbi:WecB/TagA/CpsF family glycosyltransferase [Streptomyces sp. MK7]|uniref:WecB/TagA/CpsF family glycosyltransferase n=1 Tax=Streptomyces sp. MK7 TaxID=3067635 RepID=UPI00292EEECD|nr:WecB/TagA/CpsF family glycosyltransferase [Streptomyces sp. MK7]
MNVPITAHTPESAAQHVVDLARRIRAARGAGHTTASAVRRAADAVPRGDVHLCNAYTLALADRDPNLRSILRTATVNLPDGQPVVWANRLLHRGTVLPATRVYGPDLLLDVISLGRRSGLRHYLLGSTPHVLDALHGELRRRFPQALITGTCSPPFRSLTAAELCGQRDDVRAADADIVWVGLGTPKQDRWAAELCTELPVVSVAVGAAFDFIAGAKPQAPPWMRRSGLEWAFRLGCEPRRLWRRYLFGNVQFLQGVMRQAMSRG